MLVKHKVFSRSFAVASVLALAVAAIAPALFMGQADAAQVTARSILMSTAQKGATATTYSVSFTLPTPLSAYSSNLIKGVVVDFCADSPLLGLGTCTNPNAFSVGAGTITNFKIATVGKASWVGSQLNSNRTLVVTKAAGDTVAAGNSITFDLTTATNPNVANTTFYARIYTYDSDANASAYTLANAMTNSIDAGAVAMTTASTLNVQAKVQEKLQFCVYTGSCGSTDPATVYLGDATNHVLDTSATYINKQAKIDMFTNAQSGVAITIKGLTLTSGGNSITGIGAAAAMGAPGSGKQFGLCASQTSGAGFSPDAAFTGGTGCAAATEPSTPGGAYFGFPGSMGTGVAFGTLTATNASTATLGFAANITNTTEAGLYQTNLTFVATGTY